jgi:anti-sigma factor RsiW
MITHDQALERLDDYVGDELPETERLAVQTHLAACESCRAEAEALRELLREAATLPRGIAPERDLWAGIAARLEPRGSDSHGEAEKKLDTKVIPLFPRPARNPRWLQAAAAVVLVGLSSALTYGVMKHGEQQQVAVDTTRPAAVRPASQASPQPAPAAVEQPQTQPSTEAQPSSAEPTQPQVRLASNVGRTSTRPAAPRTALAAFRPAEREYQKAAGDLERLLRAQSSRMSPATRATLQRNLRIIDQAIAESKAALLKDPNNRELAQMLSAVYDSKIETLQRAVTL